MAGEAQKGRLAELDAQEKAVRDRARKLAEQSATPGAITGLPEEERPEAMAALMDKARAHQVALEKERATTERNQPIAETPAPKKRITMHEAEEGNK